MRDIIRLSAPAPRTGPIFQIPVRGVSCALTMVARPAPCYHVMLIGSDSHMFMFSYWFLFPHVLLLISCYLWCDLFSWQYLCSATMFRAHVPIYSSCSCSCTAMIQIQFMIPGHVYLSDFSIRAWYHFCCSDITFVVLISACINPIRLLEWLVLTRYTQVY